MYGRQPQDLVDHAFYLADQVLRELIQRQRERLDQDRAMRAAQDAAIERQVQARRDAVNEAILEELRETRAEQAATRSTAAASVDSPRHDPLVASLVVGAATVAYSEMEARESAWLTEHLAEHPSTRAFMGALADHLDGPSDVTLHALLDAALELEGREPSVGVGRFALVTAYQASIDQPSSPARNYVGAMSDQYPNFAETMAGLRPSAAEMYASLDALIDQEPFNRSTIDLRKDVQGQLHRLEQSMEAAREVTPFTPAELDAANDTILDAAQSEPGRRFAAAVRDHRDDPSDRTRTEVYEAALEVSATAEPATARFALLTAQQVADGVPDTPMQNYLASLEVEYPGSGALLAEQYPQAADAFDRCAALADREPFNRGLDELGARTHHDLAASRPERMPGRAPEGRSTPTPARSTAAKPVVLDTARVRPPADSRGL